MKIMIENINSWQGPDVFQQIGVSNIVTSVKFGLTPVFGLNLMEIISY